MFSPCVLIPFSCNRKHTSLNLSSVLSRTVTYIQTRGTLCIVTILLDDALGLGQVGLLGVRLPPIPQVALHIKLPTLVIETVGNLVTNHVSDGAEIHVLGALGIEEVSLQDASREFYGRNKILDKRSARHTGRLVTYEYCSQGKNRKH